MKESDGSRVACHATKTKAEAQLRALYANEKTERDMDLFKVNGERFDLAVPITKYNESTGEFEAWATVEQLDKSNEIIDIDKSFPFFMAHSQKFADATGGQSFGNVREQHDPKRAAGKLIAPPEVRKHDSGARGIYVKGLAVDPLTKEKLAQRVLVGVSIGGRYEEKSAADDVKKGATRYVANPSEYSLVDNPCVPDALITVVKADGTETIDKARGFNPPQGFLCHKGAFHPKKDEARDCHIEHGDEVVKVALATPTGAWKVIERIEKKHDMQDDPMAHDPEHHDEAHGAASGEEKDEEPPDEQDDSDEKESAADQGDGKKKKKKLNGQKADKPDVAKITAERRKALPDSDFGLPSKRKYPIDTKARARNALSRAAQNATPEEQAEIKRRVHERYPDIGEKSLNPVVEKCLSCVSQLASIISNSEGLIAWLENVEAYDDNDGAEYAIAEQMEEANKILYAALHDMLDDAEADAQADDYDENDETPSIDDITDEAPAAQMAALVESLKKKETIRTLLTKSLRVRTGNGSKDSNENKEVHMDKNQKPEDLSKATSDAITKAVSDGVTAALEPVTKRFDDFDKAAKERNERVDKVIKAIVDRMAPTKAAKRVTKADDTGATGDHSKKVEKTALELLGEQMEKPMAYEAGVLRRPNVAASE